MENLSKSGMAPQYIPLHLIEEFTNHFSEDQKIGNGTYGDVYKGTYKGEKVAVKMLRFMPEKDDKKQLRKEFENIVRLRHENIVRLIAYSYEAKYKYVTISDSAIDPRKKEKESKSTAVLAAEIRRALCFEYMQNGSVQKHLQDEFHGLDWPTRYKIIKGTCEALEYLHEGVQPPVLHLDLKPDNILLDKNMVPKLADFGLSKLFTDEQTRSLQRAEQTMSQMSCAVGTMGYTPPEYIDKNEVSNKFDIFSLGVIIIKIMTGREGYSKYDEKSPRDEFIDQVHKNWRERLKKTAAYTALDEECNQVKTCIKIALDCVEHDPNERPNIGSIVRSLKETEDKIEKLEISLPRDEQINDPWPHANKMPASGVLKVPQQLCYRHPIDLNRKLASSLELENMSFKPVAYIFTVSGDLEYTSARATGIISPGAKWEVLLNMKVHNASVLQQENEVILRSTIVSGDLNPKDITSVMLETDRIVDEVKLDVVIEASAPHQQQEEIADPTKILDVQPLELHFPYDRNKYVLCPVHLTNVRDEHVAFRLIERSGESGCFVQLPLHGILQPRSTHTLMVTTKKLEGQPLKPDYDLILQSCVLGGFDDDWLPFEDQDECEEFFTEVEKRGALVHEVQMKASTEVSYSDFSASEPQDKVDSMENLSNSGVAPQDKILQRLHELCSSEDSISRELDILERGEKPSSLRLRLLQLITDNFSDELKIGFGGCGAVYKGILRHGIIAVKKLFNGHTIDDKMFHQEVTSIIRVKDKNVVRLLGYCSYTEEQAFEIHGKMIMAQVRERLLCFEYVSNGNLEDRITDELRGLEWNTRYQIIKGISDGLRYLHMKEHIIHMDLKPANILLDDSMVPKITDFGISRMDDKTQTVSVDRLFSKGYCAPEYLHHGKMSPKSDIYSLGVIILEIVTGSKEKPSISKQWQVLKKWKYRWTKTAVQKPLWYKQVTNCLKLALSCTSNDPGQRPDISNIIHELQKMDSMDEEASNTTDEFQELRDMLGVDPLTIHLPIELNKLISRTVELTNNTDDYFAFKISTSSLRQYDIDPSKDIVAPRSKCSVTITLHALESAPHYSYRKDEFSVQSTKVDGCLTVNDISDGMFNEKAGNEVDDVNLMILIGQEIAVSATGELLDIKPLQLHFPSGLGKLMACSMKLTNKTDEKVAFRLWVESDEEKSGFLNLPLCGVVLPTSTYTLVVTTKKLEEAPRERYRDLILESSGFECRDIYSFGEDPKLDEFFSDAEKAGKAVQEVTIRAVYGDQQGKAISEGTTNGIKILYVAEYPSHNRLQTVDVHPIDPWIVTGYGHGHVCILDSEMQGPVASIEDKMMRWGAICVRFIVRKKWIVAGSADGCIYVYSYENNEMQNIGMIDANIDPIVSLAVHPTLPLVLSAARSGIQLWNWDKQWECTKEFDDEHSDYVNQVVFNPVDTNSFASASWDRTVKVWNFDTPSSVCTLKGHMDNVNCLHYFACDSKQYLITGSDDETAKIWDLETKVCVQTLDAFASAVLSVCSHPSLPLLVTGSWDGVVCLWSSTTFRLKKALHFGLGRVVGLRCFKDSRRIVIGQDKRLSVIELEEEHEGSGDQD